MFLIFQPISPSLSLMLHMPTFRSLLVSTLLRDQGFVSLSRASFRRWAPSKQQADCLPEFNPSKAHSINVKALPACGISQLTPLTRMSFQESTQGLSKVEDLDFGPYKIHSKEVFLTTKHSFAFVNLRPVVPGHVLISSKRVIARFSDLVPDEVCDMWLTANRVGVKLEAFFNASSLTFVIQDGPAAGQTVPHVHIHILPRRNGDFEKNDEIYDLINDKEKEFVEHMNLDKERVDRTFEEMVAEASALRALFSD